MGIEHKPDVWMIRLLNKIPLPRVISPILIGIILYVFALIIFSLSPIEFPIPNPSNLESNWWFFLNFCIIGIVYSFYALDHLVSYGCEEIEKIRPVFSDKKRFQNKLDELFKDVGTDRYIVIIGIPLISIGLFVGFIILHPNLYSISYIYLSLLYCIAIFILATGIWLITSFWVYLYKLSNLKIKQTLITPDRMFGLKPIGDFCLRASVLWFIAIAISSPVLILIISDAGIMPLGFLSLMTLSGIVLFFIPQIYLHRTLKKIKKDTLDNISKQITNNWDQATVILLVLLMKFNEIEKIKEWTFWYDTLAKLFLSSTISFIPHFIELGIKSSLF